MWQTPVPILMYHHISPAPGLVTCSPDNFRAQMQWLAEQGWKTLSLAEFSAGLGSGKWPSKSVLLTFDDGYLDNWVYAYPVLKEFGLHATIFLITKWVGEGEARPYFGLKNNAALPSVPNHRHAMQYAKDGQYDAAFLRWSEVEAMRAAGCCDFHSHTHSHTRWDQQIPEQAARDAALAEDLAASRHTLLTRLGERAPHLCWPQGYFDRHYQAVAQAAGFTHLHTTQPGVVRPSTDPLALPRLVVKDKGADWFAGRMRMYAHPVWSRLYLRLKGQA